ncbi:hypothetical protein [Shimia sp. Alg240-R146]|uniref:hypothetical protein n=1 Tax=Shimia sp. Alg240-R146 TaxID=2993449 RepID=UPI0022DF45DF|nr:hypothetical protein [Shimia sp. Alg240-R146]
MIQTHRSQLIPLSDHFRDEELKNLQVFHSRFVELWENFEDLKAMGFNLNGGHYRDKHNKIQTTADLGVSRFRLKGFLVDYRHFDHQNEPAYFNSIVNKIRQRCRDADVTALLDENQNHWREAGVLRGWSNEFSANQFLQAMFGEDLFHSNPKGQRKVRMREIEAKLSSDAIWYEIAMMAYDRLLVVRNLNWILHPVYSGRCELQIPH